MDVRSFVHIAKTSVYLPELGFESLGKIEILAHGVVLCPAFDTDTRRAFLLCYAKNGSFMAGNCRIFCETEKYTLP